MSDNNGSSDPDDTATTNGSRKRKRNVNDWQVNQRKCNFERENNALPLYKEISGLTGISEMYELYLKYLNENYSLTFGRCQVNVCSECERLNAKIKDNSLNDTAKRVTIAKLIVHKRRAKKFYSN
nr:unnamed protein product [Callosobruchus analis]